MLSAISLSTILAERFNPSVRGCCYFHIAPKGVIKYINYMLHKLYSIAAPCRMELSSVAGPENKRTEL